jgi:hypothetical protein
MVKKKKDPSIFAFIGSAVLFVGAIIFFLTSGYDHYEYMYHKWSNAYYNAPSYSYYGYYNTYKTSCYNKMMTYKSRMDEIMIITCIIIALAIIALIVGIILKVTYNKKMKKQAMMPPMAPMMPVGAPVAAPQPMPMYAPQPMQQPMYAPAPQPMYAPVQYQQPPAGGPVHPGIVGANVMYNQAPPVAAPQQSAPAAPENEVAKKPANPNPTPPPFMG